MMRAKSKRQMADYRIPYQGSKNRIAESLILEMQKYKPDAKYFYDLFGGGGSMSFKALQMGYKVIYNEFDSNLSSFVKYIFDRIKNNEKSEYGLFPAEWYNFVTREEFIKQKELNTPYSEFCRIVYSFGNNRKDYLFNPELEITKHIMHNVVMFQSVKDLEKLNTRLNTDFIMPTGEDYNTRRLKLGQQIKSNKMRIDLERLERLEQLEQLQQLQQLERLEQLEILNKSYNDINIPFNDDEVIIHCDPPYRNTAGYLKDFDVEAFDRWVFESDKTIFISEYNAPFQEILAIDKRCTLSASANTARKEKLYISKVIKPKVGQLTLIENNLKELA